MIDIVSTVRIAEDEFHIEASNKKGAAQIKCFSRLNFKLLRNGKQ